MQFLDIFGPPVEELSCISYIFLDIIHDASLLSSEIPRFFIFQSMLGSDSNNMREKGFLILPKCIPHSK